MSTRTRPSKKKTNKRKVEDDSSDRNQPSNKNRKRTTEIPSEEKSDSDVSDKSESSENEDVNNKASPGEKTNKRKYAVRPGEVSPDEPHRKKGKSRNEISTDEISSHGENDSSNSEENEYLQDEDQSTNRRHQFQYGSRDSEKNEHLRDDVQSSYRRDQSQPHKPSRSQFTESRPRKRNVPVITSGYKSHNSSSLQYTESRAQRTNVPVYKPDKPSMLQSGKKGGEKRGSNLLFIMNILGFFLIVTAICLILLISQNDDNNTGHCNPYRGDDCNEYLREELLRLKEDYPDQNSEMWMTLHSAAFSHISPNPSPERPVVILVYSVSNRSSVDDHYFAQQIGSIYETILSPNRARGLIEIDGEKLHTKDSESVKEELARVLETGFSDEDKNVAIVHNFDRLPSCSVLTFYNYCNNDKAPYTDVAIILTITGNPEVLPESKSKKLEEAVSKNLREKWKDCPRELPAGKIDAMLSRISNNVILFT